MQRNTSATRGLRDDNRSVQELRRADNSRSWSNTAERSPACTVLRARIAPRLDLFGALRNALCAPRKRSQAEMNRVYPPSAFRVCPVFSSDCPFARDTDTYTKYESGRFRV